VNSDESRVLHAPNQPLTIEEVELTSEEREVLRAPPLPGWCHSDLHYIEGLYPHPTPVVLGRIGGQSSRRSATG